MDVKEGNQNPIDVKLTGDLRSRSIEINACELKFEKFDEAVQIIADGFEHFNTRQANVENYRHIVLNLIIIKHMTPNKSPRKNAKVNYFYLKI